MMKPFAILSAVILFAGCASSDASLDTAEKRRFLELTRFHGLDAYSGAIWDTGLPSVRLHPAGSPGGADAPDGAATVGGKPRMPPGFEWPAWNGKSLSFIAQIDCSRLPPEARDAGLPDDGMLYFFYDAEQGTWGFDPLDKGSWKVVYAAPTAEPLAETEFPPDLPEYARFAATPMRAAVSRSFPSPFTARSAGLGMAGDSDMDYLDFMDDWVAGGFSMERQPVCRMFGYPDVIQNEMELDCELASNGLYLGDGSGYADPRAEALERGAGDWILLLQVDSVDSSGMMWGDGGMLYFWIRRGDLKEKNFDDAWMILQCG